MLILLSSIYVGIIWLVFVKMKWLPWNKGTKAGSVIVGVVGLIAVLIGFGMGAPTASGGMMITNPVTSLSAHSFGRVTKVHVGINEPVQANNPIFEVDPTLYEIAVRAAEAGLEQARSGVRQLRAAWAAAQADVRVVSAEMQVLEASIDAAKANVSAATSAVDAAESGVRVAEADVRKSQVDVDIGQVQFDRIQDLVQQAVQSQAELDQATRKLEGFRAGLDRATAAKTGAEEELARVRASLEGAQAALAQAERQRESLQAQQARAEAAERKAYAAAEIDGEGEHSSVRIALEKVANASYDLEQCVVRAPSDGYVVALGLTVGDYVRMVQVGTFVKATEQRALAYFTQNTVRFIEPGMPVEIVLRMYPGRVFSGTVEAVTFAAGEAQMPATGTIPAVNSLQVPQRFPVRIRLDGFPADTPPQFAASGSVAVYTDAAKPIHVVRKIVLRMESMLNWLPL